MSRVLVIEGTDGTGKTTLALDIAAKYGYTYKWLGKPEKGEAWSFYSKTYCDVITGEKTIFDRSHFSEEVYGPIFRGGSELHTCEVNALTDLLGESVVIVWCIRDTKAIKETLAETPGDLHHDKDPDEIQTQYAKVLFAQGLRIVHYDFSEDTVEELMERIC